MELSTVGYLCVFLLTVAMLYVLSGLEIPWPRRKHVPTLAPKNAPKFATHPRGETLRAYVLRPHRLERTVTQKVSDHLLSCPECAQEVQVMRVQIRHQNGS